MRVALFTDTYFEINGAARTLRQVASRAHQFGVKLDVYTYGPECKTTQEGEATVFQFNNRLAVRYYEGLRFEVIPDFRIRRAFQGQMRQDPYQLIHLATPGSIGLVGRAFAKQNRLAQIGTYHTHLADYSAMRSIPGSRRLMHRFFWWYMRWFYRDCHAVQCPTPGVVEELRDRGFKNRLGIFTRGIDTERFNPVRRTRDAAQTLVSYVGRIAREKNVGWLPQVLTGQAADVHIVGDGPERAWLQDQLPTAHFAGYLHGENLAEAYANSDLLVFPSQTDTFGNVVLEAMASGAVPLVATGPGPSEFVEAGVNAEVCGSAEDMHAKLQHLIANPARRLSMSQAARQFAESRSWDAAIGELMQAYREAAAGAKA